MNQLTLQEEKEHKTLIDLLNDKQVVSIVGNSKNAGKTTVLNFLLSKYQEQVVGITSIGLDGEKIDQVTFLPKPRIHTYKGMIVATAKDCLEQCTAGYEIIKETNIKSSLGEIVIIKIIEEGNCLVGGPSNLKDIKLITDELKNLDCYKVLLDGAFSRTTLASVSDATILAIGASFSMDIEKIVLHAKNTVKLFGLKKYIGELDFSIYKNITLVFKNNETKELTYDSTLDFGKTIIKEIKAEATFGELKYIYIPKAVSPSFLKALIEARNFIRADIITTNPTNLLVDDKLINYLFKLENKVYVLEEINLVAITMNPFSPKGNVSADLLKKRLKEEIDLEIFNVLEKSS